MNKDNPPIWKPLTALLFAVIVEVGQGRGDLLLVQKPQQPPPQKETQEEPQQRTRRRRLWEWTGFGEKKLWDWMQLLFIPVVLALGGYLFTLAQDARQQAIEEQRAQDAALQSYFDQMGALLENGDLRDSESEARGLARARTLSILERLAPAQEERPSIWTRSDEQRRRQERQREVLEFLYGANLINKENPAASLYNANLTYADLREINLKGADLSGVNLHGATMEPRNPGRGKGADLSDANLTYADLGSVKLSRVDLSGADLTGATNITDTQLRQPYSLEGATMPDGSKHD